MVPKLLRRVTFTLRKHSFSPEAYSLHGNCQPVHRFETSRSISSNCKGMATSAVIHHLIDCLKDLSQCEMPTTEAFTAAPQASQQYTDSAAQDHPASTTSSEKQRLVNIIRSIYITIRECQEVGPREVSCILQLSRRFDTYP